MKPVEMKQTALTPAISLKALAPSAPTAVPTAALVTAFSPNGSRLSAEQAAEQGNQWADLQSQSSRNGERLVWLEFDASQGRNQLRCRRAGSPSTIITPAGYSVRSRVHEYGGGSYRIANNGLVFVNESDQGLYWHSFDDPDSVSLIRQVEGFRYGDLQFDQGRNRIIAVEEQHCDDGVVHNRLVAIALADTLSETPAAQGTDPGTVLPLGQRRVLVQGADFYSSPRLSPDATQLAWISWDHPHQPWSSSRLWLGQLDADGVPQGQRTVTQGQHQGQNESVQQPEFGADGGLYFLSDRSGWWNLYRYWATGDGYIESLLPRSIEFARAPWQLGQQAYVLLDNDRLGCSWWHAGKAELAILRLSTGELTRFGRWAAVHSLAIQAGELLAVVESTTEPGQVVRCCETVQSNRSIERLAVLSEPLHGAVVTPEHVTIKSPPFETVYGLLYRPTLPSTRQLPLIIQLHGGPTAQADGRFDPLKQYWLQRGFALLDLNYRGSTGYGRAYRQRLQGQWGISDVEDVIASAQFFINQGWVDPDRIVIRGNSAGGYTCLQVLSQTAGQRWVRTGASHYGISDLERLARETHKFESHYLDWLIGDLAEQRLNYRLRSPIHRPKDFCRPLIFFQGGLDRVVPATQTFTLYNQLKGRGLSVEYLAFADERHGFRQARNRARVLQREWQFYCHQLALPDSDDDLLCDGRVGRHLYV